MFLTPVPTYDVMRMSGNISEMLSAGRVKVWGTERWDRVEDIEHVSEERIVRGGRLNKGARVINEM